MKGIYRELIDLLFKIEAKDTGKRIRGKFEKQWEGAIVLKLK